MLIVLLIGYCIITLFENKDICCGQSAYMYITGSAILAFRKISKTIISGIEIHVCFWPHFTNINVKDLEMNDYPKG